MATRNEKGLLHRLLVIAMSTSMGCCIFMVAITVLDVFSRHALAKPIPGVIELNEVLLVCVVYLGLGLSQKDGAQIRAELFISHLAPSIRKIFDVFSAIVAFAFWAAVLVQSATKAWSSFVIGEYREGLLKFPVWPARWALAIGTFLICLQLLSDMKRSFVVRGDVKANK